MAQKNLLRATAGRFLSRSHITTDSRGQSTTFYLSQQSRLTRNQSFYFDVLTKFINTSIEYQRILKNEQIDLFNQRESTFTTVISYMQYSCCSKKIATFAENILMHVQNSKECKSERIYRFDRSENICTIVISYRIKLFVSKYYLLRRKYTNTFTEYYVI